MLNMSQLTDCLHFASDPFVKEDGKCVHAPNNTQEKRIKDSIKGLKW